MIRQYECRRSSCIARIASAPWRKGRLTGTTTRTAVMQKRCSFFHLISRVRSKIAAQAVADELYLVLNRLKFYMCPSIFRFDSTRHR